jgi:hypothetical protein
MYEYKHEPCTKKILVMQIYYRTYLVLIKPNLLLQTFLIYCIRKFRMVQLQSHTGCGQ